MKKIKKQPFVSVIMPAYNAENYIGEAIRSIITQSYKNWELIVVNDASTDNTLQIARQYKNRYPKKIRLINLQTSLKKEGDPAANIGILHSRGSYIAKMDADDIAEPHRLAKQVAFLENNKHYSVVGSSAYVIDREGEIIGNKKMPKDHLDIYREYINFHPMIHPTIMFRKKIMGKKKYFYLGKYSTSNDYYTLFTLICQGHRFKNLDENLLRYRIYGGNSSFQNIKRKFINTLKIKIEMVLKFYYPINTKAALQTALQTAAVLLLPQSLSMNLYLLKRGIITRHEFTKKLLFYPARKAEGLKKYLNVGFTNL